MKPTFVFQATTYAVEGKQVPVRKPHSKFRRLTPLYTAFVYNADGSVYDYRSTYNDNELYHWINSFGFQIPTEQF